MKILVINGGRNKNVQLTITTLKNTLGASNVDVIEYGREGQKPLYDDTTMYQNTIELHEILTASPELAKKYDLLLIAGGHGKAILNTDSKTGFVKHKFNSLSLEGALDLVAYFQNNNVTFKNILLGTCFSSIFQDEFKNLLADKTGTILGFTSIATSNFCSLAENIAKGERPEMDVLITHGLLTVMTELIADIPPILTDLESRLVENFLPVNAVVLAEEKLTNFIASSDVALPHNIGDAIYRLNSLYYVTLFVRVSEKYGEKIRAIIEKNIVMLTEILEDFTSIPVISSQFVNDAEKIDGTCVETIIKVCACSSDIVVQNALEQIKSAIQQYNCSNELRCLKLYILILGQELTIDKNAQLLNFMANNYQDIVNSDNSMLTSGIESTLSIYHNNVTYVRTADPKNLPRDVIAASKPREIPIQSFKHFV